MEVLKEERIQILIICKNLRKQVLVGGARAEIYQLEIKVYDLIAISPSGVSYDSLNWEMVPVVDRTGEIISGIEKTI